LLKTEKGAVMSEKNIKKMQYLIFVNLVLILFVAIRLMMVEKRLDEMTSEKVMTVSEQETVEQEKTSPDEMTVDENEVPDLSVKEEKVVVKDENTYSFSIPVTASFYNTFGDSREISELAAKTGNDRLSELLSAHISRNLVFSMNIRKDLYPGDHISAVFRTVSEKEQTEREDMPDEIEILAMKYKSTKLKKIFRFYSFKTADRKFSAFFDESGYIIEKPLKNSPLKEWIQITSVLKDRRPKHDGIDFKALTGTPVYAPWSGKVLRTNWKTRYNGLSIEAEVDSTPRAYMILLHLDKVLVKPGDTFKQGDHIADVGNTGRSFAPHLHYQLQKEPGRTRAILDPIKFHGTVDWKLPEKEISAFEKSRNGFDKMME